MSLAFYKASKGKRYRHDVQSFGYDLDKNIQQLAQDIRAERLPYGRFREFQIYDPKKRLIHAACFEDRIFHHALMNISGSVLEKAMSPTSFACRPEKGVHKAVKQVQKHLRSFAYYGKIDINGYFASIPHQKLLDVLMTRFKGLEIKKQFKRCIDCYENSPQTGLPIGSLTSQYFANYYLDGLDRFLNQRVSVRANIRYMDDIIWWCDNKQQVKHTLLAIKKWMQERELQLKSNVQIQPSNKGVTYCGFRILQGSIRLSRRRKRRFLQRRQYWEKLYQQGLIDELHLQKAYASVEAITAGTDSLAWRKENLRLHPPLNFF